MHAECAFLSVSSGSVWKQAYLSYFVRRNLQSTVQYGFTLLILKGVVLEISPGPYGIATL